MKRKSAKLIAMLTAIALLAGLASAALADERIFTSEAFSVPKERLKKEIREELARREEEPAADQPGGEPEEDRPGETEAPSEPVDPDAPAERQVKIYSNRKEVVTDGDIIELTSELIGFGDTVVHYQWQVDRNDEKGWQDVEGATRWKHSFIATRETILYDWRLIVTVDDE